MEIILLGTVEPLKVLQGGRATGFSADLPWTGDEIGTPSLHRWAGEDSLSWVTWGTCW